MLKVKSWEKWVAEMGRCELPINCFNPYQKSLCQQNLTIYLGKMAVQRPSVLLVGEALGYRGGCVTGIPFVSKRVLETHSFFGDGEYCLPPDDVPQSEATATIVWETLGRLPHLPLLWNAFPFHPFRPKNPNSNRAPKSAEIAIGAPFLLHLINHFPITTTIAIGNRADHALNRLNIPHHKVRHPSFGGKRAFVEQLLSGFSNPLERTRKLVVSSSNSPFNS